MKKLLIIAAVAILAAVSVYAFYCFALRKSAPEGSSTEQIVSILRQNDCMVCHSQNPDLPFYASFPVIGPMMDEHVSHAVRFTDLEGKVNEDVDEVTLSMIQHAVEYGTMPIKQYRLIHWGTGFNAKESAALLEWVKAKRGCDEPVCPVPASVEYDAAKAGLGERMYYDNRISLDGTINCATCHILENGGADENDERVSTGINGLKGGVNSPTVYNSVFNVRQFWNGRAADLREQAEGPATNPVEMGDQTWDQIVERLSADKALVQEFKTLYPGEGLTKMSVTGAIAEFEKTLITPDSPFDKYLKGDNAAISGQAAEGYEAFKKNACATCHTGVNLGGKSFEYLDVYGNYFADRSEEIKYNSDDDGLKGFSGKDVDLHRFKVPGLRNIALTSPYFHDGTMSTLEDAVRAMAKYELGKELAADEVASILAFLNTLTGFNPHLYSLN